MESIRYLQGLNGTLQPNKDYTMKLTITIKDISLIKQQLISLEICGWHGTTRIAVGFYISYLEYAINGWSTNAWLHFRAPSLCLLQAPVIHGV